MSCKCNNYFYCDNCQLKDNQYKIDHKSSNRNKRIDNSITDELDESSQLSELVNSVDRKKFPLQIDDMNILKNDVMTLPNSVSKIPSNSILSRTMTDQDLQNGGEIYSYLPEIDANVVSTDHETNEKKVVKWADQNGKTLENIKITKKDNNTGNNISGMSENMSSGTEFALIFFLIIICVIVVLGFIGWRNKKKMGNKKIFDPLNMSNFY